MIIYVLNMFSQQIGSSENRIPISISHLRVFSSGIVIAAKTPIFWHTQISYQVDHISPIQFH